MKIIKYLYLAVVCICINASSAASQDLSSEIKASSSQQLGNTALVILYAHKANFKLEDESSKQLIYNAKINPEFDNAEVYDLSAKKEFGSYVNPHTNFLKVVSKNETVYTKAQLTEKSTGKKVFSMNIEKGNNAIDLTHTAAGTYILILTDGGNNIYSEELTIF